MMRSAQSVLAALMLVSGCATRGNVELLESQLRQQEDALYAARSDREQAVADLRIAQREVQALRVQLSEQGKETLLPEQAHSLYRVAGVRVNEWFSGGLDRDDRPGDDLLNIMLIPHDEQGETVKLPGRVELEVIDFSAPESSRKLGVWKFDAEQVADRWQSGLTSGFQFRVPLEKPPVSENIVLHARYATVDGRQFQTTADLRVTPPEIQYAGPSSPSTDAPALRTSVKPINAPAPRMEVVQGGRSADRKPAPQESQPLPSDGKADEFFPVKMIPDEKPHTETRDRRDEEFFPENSTFPPKPAPASPPTSNEWGWKPLDPLQEKTPPQQSSDDFQTAGELPPRNTLKNNEELPQHRNVDESQWPNLPSPDAGERKPDSSKGD